MSSPGSDECGEMVVLLMHWDGVIPVPRVEQTSSSAWVCLELDVRGLVVMSPGVAWAFNGWKSITRWVLHSITPQSSSSGTKCQEPMGTLSMTPRWTSRSRCSFTLPSQCTGRSCLVSWDRCGLYGCLPSQTGPEGPHILFSVLQHTLQVVSCHCWVFNPNCQYLDGSQNVIDWQP